MPLVLIKIFYIILCFHSSSIRFYLWHNRVISVIYCLQAPASEIQDKISFIINNISALNIEAKARECTEILKEQYYPWFAQYMVMKRSEVLKISIDILNICLQIMYCMLHSMNSVLMVKPNFQQSEH